MVHFVDSKRILYPIFVSLPTDNRLVFTPGTYKTQWISFIALEELDVVTVPCLATGMIWPPAVLMCGILDSVTSLRRWGFPVTWEEAPESKNHASSTSATMHALMTSIGESSSLKALMQSWIC